MLTDGEKQFEYDAQNRLIRVVEVATSELLAEYAYDPLGLRVSITHEEGTTYSLFSGIETIEERRADGTLLREFIPDLAMIDHTDAGDAPAGSPEVFYYLQDILGSTVAMTDAAGSVVERYAYEPYGDTVITNASGDRVDDSTVGNPFMWTGQRFESETGLYHFYARAYSSTLGRWLQRDPLGYVDGMNLYQYVSSSPMVYVDPLGLQPLITIVPGTNLALWGMSGGSGGGGSGGGGGGDCANNDGDGEGDCGGDGAGESATGGNDSFYGCEDEEEFKKLCQQALSSGLPDRQIRWAETMIEEYQQAAKDPQNKTGNDIEKAVDESLRKQGILTEVAGETNLETGQITVKPQQGPFASVLEQATMVHERVHQQHVKDLKNMYFNNGIIKPGDSLYATQKRKMQQQLDSAQDWVADEVNAYSAEIQFWNDFKAKCAQVGVN